MNTQLFLRRTAGVVTVLATATFVWATLHALFDAPPNAISSPTLSMITVASTSSLPVRLQIPSLHVDANVQYVGINTIGNMQAPDNSTDVGWYKYGTVPGFLGSAIIAGHLDDSFAFPGVFKHLGDIKVGSDIYVITQGGSKLHFVVKDMKPYPYTDAPTNFIFERSDAARLNLITCTGTWIASEQTFSERLIVFAELSTS